MFLIKRRFTYLTFFLFDKVLDLLTLTYKKFSMLIFLKRGVSKEAIFRIFPLSIFKSVAVVEKFAILKFAKHKKTFLEFFKGADYNQVSQYLINWMYSLLSVHNSVLHKTYRKKIRFGMLKQILYESATNSYADTQYPWLSKRTFINDKFRLSSRLFVKKFLNPRAYTVKKLVSIFEKQTRNTRRVFRKHHRSYAPPKFLFNNDILVGNDIHWAVVITYNLHLIKRFRSFIRYRNKLWHNKPKRRDKRKHIRRKKLKLAKYRKLPPKFLNYLRLVFFKRKTFFTKLLLKFPFLLENYKFNAVKKPSVILKKSISWMTVNWHFKYKTFRRRMFRRFSKRRVRWNKVFFDNTIRSPFYYINKRNFLKDRYHFFKVVKLYLLLANFIVPSNFYFNFSFIFLRDLLSSGFKLDFALFDNTNENLAYLDSFLNEYKNKLVFRRKNSKHRLKLKDDFLFNSTDRYSQLVNTTLNRKDFPHQKLDYKFPRQFFKHKKFIFNSLFMDNIKVAKTSPNLLHKSEKKANTFNLKRKW